jgi:ABC-2 type transport system permease protein
MSRSTLTAIPDATPTVAPPPAPPAPAGARDGAISPSPSPFTPPPRAPGGGLRQSLNDGLMVSWRNLKRVPRIPELAIFAVLQSIMFVLLFAYVFGGAIPLPGGGSYREFLMPGIYAQTVAFAAATTAIGMTDDLSKGLIDRFRSLPMARSAVLSGRTLSDLVYNGGILIVLMLSGLAVGWRVHTGPLEFLAGVALLLLFTFAMSWVGVWLGLSVPTVEVANQVAFTVIFPLTFLSNIFVPTETLPPLLRPVAEWNPVSALTAATRQLWGNPNPYATSGFPAEHPIELTLIWVAVLIAIFAPLGVRRYRSMSR